MLKRSRAPSPSPTRGDPSSPPPLDDNPCLPLPKRRRTVGPIIDSSERRDGATEGDGEDDEDSDFSNANNSTNTPTPNGKVYEHVNHFLHCLHEEQRHRSRSAQAHPGPSSHVAGHPTFSSPHESPPSFSSPLSFPAKDVRDSLYHSSSVFSTRYHDPTNPRDKQDNLFGFSDSVHDTALAMPAKAERKVEDERCRVTQKYEDTNRLLGSLVLSRRRTLSSPSVEIE